MTTPTYDPSAICLDKKLIHISEKLVLVPYLPQHVPKYHGWMSNEIILQQTASEPLSLEEEYQMQINWALDADKRTCILIPRQELHQQIIQRYNATGQNMALQNNNNIESNHIFNRLAPEQYRRDTCNICGSENVIGDTLTSSTDNTTLFCCQLCECIAACGDAGVDVAVGDVNLFFHDYLQDDNDDEDQQEQCVGADDDEVKQPVVAEVEIMIAEESARRHGYGQIALKLMTQYAIEWLNIKRFIAKINNDNTPSLNMFQKKLNYRIFDVVECFDEVHLDWLVDEATDYPFYPASINPPVGYTPFDTRPCISTNSNNVSSH